VSVEHSRNAHDPCCSPHPTTVLGRYETGSYRWKKQFAGLGVSEIRRLKQLEDENARLKKLVADLTLDKTMLQDVLKRKW
jgi:putative transposase